MIQNVAILIPAFNPPNSFLKYIKKLINVGFNNLIIVNDGSHIKFESIFNELATIPECTILNHVINLGKGRSLKDGINYYLNTKTNEIGLITVDSDGQHLCESVISIARFMEENKNKGGIYLGYRNFDSKNVPFNSKFGNKVTRLAFKLLYGMRIKDTQTGLRGFSNDVLKEVLDLYGERFEYETNVLIKANYEKIPLYELPIETIYLNANSETHFNALKDSIKIYIIIFKEFFKYGTISIISFLIDIVFFGVFLYLFRNLYLDNQILVSTVLARAISSLFNYYFNCKVAFKNKSIKTKTMIKYYILCVIQGLCSAKLVQFFTLLMPFTSVFCKIIVDTFLYFFSFRIQKFWVFKEVK